MRTMGASVDVLERLASVSGDSALTCRIFVSFLPISDSDRAACGFCGLPSEQAEAVGTWGTAFTCRQHRLHDPEGEPR